MILKEDRSMYRGIFWIKDIDDIPGSGLYFTIPCDSNGCINDTEFQINNLSSSTGGDNYNHKRLWSTLDKSLTDGKPFNYYPRGRVEISNGIVKVFYSPYLDSNDLRDWVEDVFNLTKSNGIKKIKMIPDGSNHYRCYLDD